MPRTPGSRLQIDSAPRLIVDPSRDDIGQRFSANMLQNEPQPLRAWDRSQNAKRGGQPFGRDAWRKVSGDHRQPVHADRLMPDQIEKRRGGGGKPGPGTG